MSESELIEWLNSTECYYPWTNLTKTISRIGEARTMVAPGYIRQAILLREVEDYLLKIKELLEK